MEFIRVCVNERGNEGSDRLIVCPAVIFFKFVHKSLKILRGKDDTVAQKQNFSIIRRDAAYDAILFILVALISKNINQLKPVIYTSNLLSAMGFSFTAFIIHIFSSSRTEGRIEQNRNTENCHNLKNYN